MIVDTSAIIAILKQEAEASSFAEAMELAVSVRISAVSYVEAGAVVDGARDPVATRRLDELMATARIQIEPVTEAQARIARQAYRDFGKGSGHAARLNFGDCFSYALAHATGEELLFKGRDFVETDVRRSAVVTAKL